MAKLPIKANTKTNKSGMGFEPMDAGNYVGQIIKSDYMPTKAKNGHYLKLQMKILMGKYKGRMMFENLNLDNPNPIAVEIANKALNSICQACGLAGVEDSEEVHGIPMLITVTKKNGKGDNPPENNISMYKKFDGEIEEDAEAPQETKGSKKLPWKK